MKMANVFHIQGYDGAQLRQGSTHGLELGEQRVRVRDDATVARRFGASVGRA